MQGGRAGLMALLVVLPALSGCVFGARDEPIEATMRVVDVVEPTDCEGLGLTDACLLVEVESLRDQSAMGIWYAVGRDGERVAFVNAPLLTDLRESERWKLALSDVPRTGVEHLVFENPDGRMLIGLDVAIRVEDVPPLRMRDARVTPDADGCWRVVDVECHRVTATLETPTGRPARFDAREVIATDGRVYVPWLDDSVRDALDLQLRLPPGVEPAVVLVEDWPGDSLHALELGPDVPQAPVYGEVTLRVVEDRLREPCEDAAYGWACRTVVLEVGNGLDDWIYHGSATVRSDSGLVTYAAPHRLEPVAAGAAALVRLDVVVAGELSAIELSDEVPALRLGKADAQLPPAQGGGRIRVEAWRHSDDCGAGPCVLVDLRLQGSDVWAIERPLLVDAAGAILWSKVGAPAAGRLEPPADVRYTLAYPGAANGTPRSLILLSSLEALDVEGAWTQLPDAGANESQMARELSQDVPRPWPVEMEILGVDSEVVDKHVVRHAVDVRVESRADRTLWFTGYVPLGTGYGVIPWGWNVSTTDGALWQITNETLQGIVPNGSANIRLALTAPTGVAITEVELRGASVRVPGAPVRPTPPPGEKARSEVHVDGVHVTPEGTGLVRVHLDYHVTAGPDEPVWAALRLFTTDGGAYDANERYGPPVVMPGGHARYHARFLIPAFAHPSALSWEGGTAVTLADHAGAAPEPLAERVVVWRLAECAPDAQCLRVAFQSEVAEDFFTDAGVSVTTSTNKVYQASSVTTAEAYAQASWRVVDVELPRGQTPAFIEAAWLLERTMLPPPDAWLDG